MVTGSDSTWAAAPPLAAALLAISAIAAFSGCFYRRRSSRLSSRVHELEASLKASIDRAASERRGRTRAQQALRDAFLKRQSARSAGEAAASTCSYPMAPIGTVRSCFTTRNGTPRQPLLVPLARGCLVLNPSRATADTLDGLAEYSHCWILYVFHLNTDLDKLWKQSPRSKFKAKVRVPRLKGGKMGVLATRSPHRPCPIGLTVAKVEAVDKHTILLSGVDLVDGTPVLDIKPYLPYSDCIEGATVPKWLEEDNALKVGSVSFSPDFLSSLAECWETAGESSMYSSAKELACLVKQVLTWDIRSFSQRSRPHHVGPISKSEESEVEDLKLDQDSASYTNGEAFPVAQASKVCSTALSFSMESIAYHLVLEGIDIMYHLDAELNVTVEKAAFCGKNDERTVTTRKWRNRSPSHLD